MKKIKGRRTFSGGLIFNGIPLVNLQIIFHFLLPLWLKFSNLWRRNGCQFLGIISLVCFFLFLFFFPLYKSVFLSFWHLCVRLCSNLGFMGGHAPCSKHLLDQEDVDMVNPLDKEKGVTLEDFKLIKMHMANCMPLFLSLFFFPQSLPYLYWCTLSHSFVL